MLNQLVLVPTALELQYVEALRERLAVGSALKLCGLGPIVSAARAAQLITQLQPQIVLLVGIAGAIGGKLKVGTAYEFSEVATYGIGVGGGVEYQTTQELGWRQWSSDSTVGVGAAEVSAPADEIGDCLRLNLPQSSIVNRQLLTVCAASASLNDVAERQHKFPNACAEDMEGFAVATACKLAGVPVRIVRGISNMAGDRNKQNWQIAAAMNAAARLVNQVLDL